MSPFYCYVHSDSHSYSDSSGAGAGGSGGSASASGSSSGSDSGRDLGEMEDNMEGKEGAREEECAGILTSEEDEGDSITSSTAYTAVTCSLLCMDNVIKSSDYQVINTC